MMNVVQINKERFSHTIQQTDTEVIIKPNMNISPRGSVRWNYINNQSEPEKNNQLRELNLKQNKSLINKLKAVIILTTPLQ